MTTNQEENVATLQHKPTTSLPFLLVLEERITTPERARELAAMLTNWANISFVINSKPLDDFFDLAYKDKTAQTIDIDKPTLESFQNLINQHDFTKSVIGLMKWYALSPRLNLMFQPDAIENVPHAFTYVQYPAQKARTLRIAQTIYRSVQVRFDSPSGRLGIFCQHESQGRAAGQTFIGNLADNLRLNPIREMKWEDVPKGYQQNRTLLKQALEKRMPEHIIVIHKTGPRVIFFARAQISS